MHDLLVHFDEKVKDNINMQEHLKILNCVMNVVNIKHVGNLLTKDRFCRSKCHTFELNEQGLHH